MYPNEARLRNMTYGFTIHMDVEIEEDCVEWDYFEKFEDKLEKIEKDSNPNGSSNNIAGILNEKKNILGMMPHPERLIDPLLSGEDGAIIFQSLLKSK